MQVSNIKIVLDNGQLLDYKTPESLGIKLNRIVDDYNQPEKRFGEFSFTISLPKTSLNNQAWQWPDVKGRTQIFAGKTLNCKVFNNADLLLDGVIELRSIDQENYKCLFYSSYTQLLDAVKGKKLVDMTALPTIPWDYEDTIIAHILSEYTIDDTDYQFPFIFYKTPFMSGATGTNDTTSDLKAEDNLGYYYNYVSTSLPYGNQNPRYYRSMPPAIYLVSILKGIMSDAGWQVGGGFIQNEDVKKIIIPFAGEPEDFAGSLITGGTGTTLNLNKLLPDVNIIDFIRSTINAFNLYFTIDPTNKQINFDSYSTLFTSNNHPHDITLRVDKSSIVKEKPDVETKISFDEDDDNNLVAGYGRIFDYETINSGEPNPTYTLCVNNRIRDTIGKSWLTKSYNKNAFENVWNKTSGDKEIKLLFSPANYYSYVIINDIYRTDGFSYSSAEYPSPVFTIGVPLISEQTPTDNKGYPYADDAEMNYCQGNATDQMVYEGGIKMYFYYGLAAYDFAITPPAIAALAGPNYAKYADWVWFGIATGGSCNAPTMSRLRVPVASPFQLLSNPQLAVLREQVSGFTLSNKQSELGAEAHYLLATYYSVGTTGNTHTPTSFSLTLGQNQNWPNLYSYFHKQKYDRIRNGYVLTADMNMTSVDWHEMKINRPILYDNELYQLVAIKNYDPVKETAQIELLKK